MTRPATNPTRPTRQVSPLATPTPRTRRSHAQASERVDQLLTITQVETAITCMRRRPLHIDPLGRATELYERQRMALEALYRSMVVDRQHAIWLSSIAPDTRFAFQVAWTVQHASHLHSIER